MTNETEPAKDNINEAIFLRPAHEEDFKLIYNSWVQAYQKAGNNRYLDYYVYKDGQSKVIERLLLRGASIAIACLPEDTNHILGWVCTERIKRETVVHFVYVKQPYRRKGIGTALLEHAKVNLTQPIPCSHATYVNQVVADKFLTLYQPKLLEGGLV